MEVLVKKFEKGFYQTFLTKTLSNSWLHNDDNNSTLKDSVVELA